MNKPGKSSSVYFPNLNGLRAIGASIVMIGHVDFIKILRGIPVTPWWPIPGKIGVALFFSLSGFLITSLLFNELQTTKTIRLKDFYIRRILRIWPLYYWVVLLGLLVLNRIPALKIPVLSDAMYQNMNAITLLNVLLIIPNFTHFYIPYSDQRWSIIVEEQFYLIQPALMRLFRKRNVLVGVFCVLIFSSEILRGMIYLFHLSRFISVGALDAILEQLKYLGCIAVGCVFSALFYKKENPPRGVLFSPVTQVIVLLILVICSLTSFYIIHNDEAFDYRLYCVLFSIVVINAALNPRNIFKLETPVLDFLGKISYGIYMYHMMCIGIALAIARSIVGSGVVQDILLYVLSVGLTILVSWLSFRYFESFFLKLKPRLQALTTRRKGLAAGAPAAGAAPARKSGL
jgi:peptidoglycan/LPS O-acetylase OafA/YrhL